eukprot:512449_1
MDKHDKEGSFAKGKHSVPSKPSTIEMDTSTSYGSTLTMENICVSTCGIFLVLILCSIIFICILQLCFPNQHLYYHILSISISTLEITIIVLSIYYCSGFQWTHCLSILQLSKLWIQSCGSFIFNVIMCLLMLFHLIHHSNKWFYANAILYLFGAFSIPLPAICVRLCCEYRCDRERFSTQHSTANSTLDPLCKPLLQQSTITPPVNGSISVPRSSLLSTQCHSGSMLNMELHKTNSRKLDTIKSQDFDQHKKYVSASIAAAQPIFNDTIIKGTLAGCYLVQFILSIGNPIVTTNSFNILLEIVYQDNDILYKINHLILRTFVIMSLISVFFILMIELTDRQMMSVNYYKIIHSCKYYGGIYLMLITPSIALEIFWVRDVYAYLDMIINGIWIAINGIACVFLFAFIVYFSAVYHKTKKKSNTFYHSSPSAPLKAFVFEALFLLVLSVVYITHLLIQIISNKTIKLDCIRQLCIMILLVFQFIMLIRIKQIQKLGRLYLKRIKKIKMMEFYKLMSSLLVYNIIYVFVFVYQYFERTDYQNTKDKKYIANAFSFALPATMFFMLSHFMHLYSMDKGSRSRQQKTI